ncbi:MAG: DUF1697 domain-containing protein [Candidatus Eisenbacteria bacterium]|nr:DUF1697 domain-containing protein [Candidatus Eisenbacteria bacterium]
MKRYAAFLRGVMPFNCKMPALKAAFESAGFKDVKTVLGSGNVVFSAAPASETALARRAEAAMEREMGRVFAAVVRPVDALRALLASDPYAGFRLAPEAKRVVTFLRARPKTAPRLPIEREGARILAVRGAEVFTVYVRGPKTPVFMVLIEETFGRDVTTRTWDTVQKVAR